MLNLKNDHTSEQCEQHVELDMIAELEKNVSTKLKFFKRKSDGALVECYFRSGYLQNVVVTHSDGTTTEHQPDFIDLNMLEKGLGERPTVF